jgi:hypothetical protein
LWESYSSNSIRHRKWREKDLLTQIWIGLIFLNLLRKKFHDLVSSSTFANGIMATIMLNMVQMALQYEGARVELVNSLEFLNYIFSAIFFVEAFLKIIAYGDTYFEDSWNKFDFFVVISSILDILIFILGSQLSFLAVGP